MYSRALATATAGPASRSSFAKALSNEIGLRNLRHPWVSAASIDAFDLRRDCARGGFLAEQRFSTFPGAGGANSSPHGVAQEETQAVA
jgi:hypothetical protein